MNPRQRIDQAWDRMQDSIESAKDRVGDRADTELGIFLHKNIGTMFLFDKRVREYEQEIIDLARDGEKEEAIVVSEEMKNYILFEMRHNCRYKAKLKEVAEKVEGRADTVKQFLSSKTGQELIDRVQDLNDSELESFEDELQDLDIEEGGTDGQ